jgi:Cu2+-exporting ATPase
MSATAVFEPQCRPAAAATACRHCGALLSGVAARASGFCCAGCGYVHRLVHAQGLGDYYGLKDAVTAPADPAVFQTRDYAWLEELQRTAETSAGAARPAELTLGIQGISCAGCVWLIERVHQGLPGAGDIVVNPQYGTLRLRWWPGEFAAPEFARRLQGLGYLAGPPEEQAGEPETRGLLRRIGLCAAFAMNVMLFSLPGYFGMEPGYEWAGLFGTLSAGFATLSVLAGGSYFLVRAARALRARTLHLDLPIAIGIAGAYLGSLYGWFAGDERFVYFDFVSAFIVLMLVGRWAQVAAVERNRRRLLARQPRPAPLRLQDGREVAPEAVTAGQELRLAPGAQLPVDARLESPAAAFSLASINGEAEPRAFHGSQRVPAGAVHVGREPLALTALQDWEDSLLARLLATEVRPGARHPLLEWIVRGYVAGILLAAAGAGTAWFLVEGDAAMAWSVVTAVLVVSCPCAIALAFPLADEMAAVALRRRGVFVREGGLWPRLARVRRILFDKTGTLTLETPVLQNPEALAALAPDARRALHGLVRDNPHPVSQTLLEHLLSAGPAPVGPKVCGPVTEVIGQGVEQDGWSLGRPGWRTPLAASGTGVAGHDAELAWRGRAVARFRFSDAARPDARQELAALRRAGFAVGILSGDRPEKVTALARELELDLAEAAGGLTPGEKAARVVADEPDRTLMLGDGANDSLAFAAAGCRGTPAIHRGVLEGKADFYYLGRGIGGIRALFETDQLRRRTHRLILVFSVAYNLLAVGLAVAGQMNPLLAAILMPVNSLATLGIVSLGMRPAFRAR